VYVHPYAVVDQARLTDEARKQLGEATKPGLKAIPLMDDPKYKNLQPYSAALICPAKPDLPINEYLALLRPLFGFNSDIVSGWITSKLAPPVLAKHLAGATYAYRADQYAYFLSYYDPAAVPLLHRLAPPDWKKWFFGPLVSWWYPTDTPREEFWHRAEGGTWPEAAPPVRLEFPEELWDAMATDPYPYALLDFLNGQEGVKFNSDCYGVRLAHVEMLLEEGRAQGLTGREDLGIYVTALLKDPALEKEPRWQGAVRAAAEGRAGLAKYFVESL
jgi:hypothetical protein